MTTSARHALRRPRAILLLYGLLSLYFCWPLFATPQSLGIFDWDVHFFYYGSVLKSLFEYGQLPFWNPWYCGGNVLWQNPQIPLLSPVIPLAAVMSLPLAMKINIVLHYWVGLVGMHLLLTEGIGLIFLPAVVYLSAVGVLSGAMVLHLVVGHSVFLPCLYLPLQLHFAIRALRDGRLRHIALAAALLALMVFNGALHVMQMSLAALGLFAVATAVTRRNWRPLVTVGLIAVLGFAYAAPKLLPVTLWVQSARFVDARNTLERPDATPVEAMARVYLDRYQDGGVHFDGQRSGWYEYGNYVGGLAALLIVTAICAPFFWRGSRDRWLGISLAVTAGLLLLVSAGEFAWWAPASIATHVPLFSSFRIPSRFTIVFVLFGAGSIGWMLREAGFNQLASAPVRALVTILCVLGIVELTLQNRQQFAGAFTLRPLDAWSLKWRGGPTQLATDTTTDPYGPDSPMFRVLMTDRSFYNCYEPLQTRRVASPDGDLVSVSGTATVSDVTFSPNRIEFTATGGTVMSEISLNQNLSDGWSSTIGPVVPSLERQRPAVRLGPGQSGRFAFTFRPPGLVAGGTILLAALALTAFAWRRPLLSLMPPTERARSSADRAPAS